MLRYTYKMQIIVCNTLYILYKMEKLDEDYRLLMMMNKYLFVTTL